MSGTRSAEAIQVGWLIEINGPFFEFDDIQLFPMSQEDVLGTRTGRGSGKRAKEGPGNQERRADGTGISTHDKAVFAGCCAASHFPQQGRINGGLVTQEKKNAIQKGIRSSLPEAGCNGGAHAFGEAVIADHPDRFVSQRRIHLFPIRPGDDEDRVRTGLDRRVYRVEQERLAATEHQLLGLAHAQG